MSDTGPTEMELLIMRLDLLTAHVENLIQRVYALEGGDAAFDAEFSNQERYHP